MAGSMTSIRGVRTPFGKAVVKSPTSRPASSGRGTSRGGRK